MMLGPCRAPSSPPDTPVPRNRRPRSARAPSRRLVSSKNELPPSISRSPGSRCAASSSRTASTGGPALTMTRMRRGRARAATSSSTENAPTSSPSSPWRSSRSWVRLAVRLWTATGKPCLAALRARFWPIVARPVTPSSPPPAMPPPVSLASAGTLQDAGRPMQTSQTLPPVEQVVPGLWSVPVPIPGSPLPYVLAYAFEVPGGVVLVDPGWNAAEALAALEEGLATVGAKLEDVRGVLVTHLHPDHLGGRHQDGLEPAVGGDPRVHAAGRPRRDGRPPRPPGGAGPARTG